MFICSQPWEQLHIHLGGSVWFCCMRPSRTQRINLSKIDETDFVDMINCEEVVKLRRAFIDNKIPNFCKGCMMLQYYENFTDFANSHELEKYCVESPIGEIDFSRLNRLKESYFELTTKCNFKCVYCLHSLASFKSRVDTISESVFFDMVEHMVRNLHLEKISTTGIGEFTTIERWRYILEKLAKLYPDVGISLFSNFGHQFRNEEIMALLSVEKINISIDTVDADLFRFLRSGDVSIVLDNLRSLKKMRCAVKASTIISIASVVCDRNIFLLGQMVDFLAEEKLCDEIALTPMTLPASAAKVMNIYPISMRFQTNEDHQRIKETLKDLDRKCQDYGIRLSWSGDLHKYYTRKEK